MSRIRYCKEHCLMPTYRYQMRTAGGDTSVGMMTANSALAAAQELRRQGNTVLQLSPLNGTTDKTFGERFKALNYSSGPSSKDILNFTTQLAVMIRAGISIRAALEGIAEQSENPKFKDILLTIKQDVESGKQFSEALARYPKLFGPLYINMVNSTANVGEEGPTAIWGMCSVPLALV